MVNYTADVLGNESNFPHLSVSGGPSNIDAATRAAARTNPSRPYVDVPVNILELGDVIKQIRNRGSGILFNAHELTRTNRRTRHVRNVARTNLQYSFGIAPLVGDLVKLINFQEQVARRVQEIERLRSPKGLRRTVSLGTNSSSAVVSKYCQTNYAFYVADFAVATTEEVRVHCRWKPTNSVLSLAGPEEMRALAKRAVLGLTVDSSTLWELVPWSWLIDWGVGIGDYFKANRNIVPAELAGVHVMRHTKTRYTTPGQGSGANTMTSILFNRESKTRSPSFVAPTAHFPFLSGKQVGILASLAVTR